MALSASFIYNPNSNSVRFEIPSTSVDKTLTIIYVMSSPSDLTNMDVNWRESTDYLELTPSSKVYFINENYRGNYEVSFGDGIKAPKINGIPSKTYSFAKDQIFHYFK